MATLSTSSSHPFTNQTIYCEEKNYDTHSILFKLKFLDNYRIWVKNTFYLKITSIIIIITFYRNKLIFYALKNNQFGLHVQFCVDKILHYNNLKLMVLQYVLINLSAFTKLKGLKRPYTVLQISQKVAAKVSNYL